MSKQRKSLSAETTALVGKHGKTLTKLVDGVSFGIAKLKTGDVPAFTGKVASIGEVYEALSVTKFADMLRIKAKTPVMTGNGEFTLPVELDTYSADGQGKPSDTSYAPDVIAMLRDDAKRAEFLTALTTASDGVGITEFNRILLRTVKAHTRTV